MEGPVQATDTLSLISEIFAPLAGKRILDIGCGQGALSRALTARGAEVVGIDPNAAAIARAREAAPAATFHALGAESLPFSDESFDGVVLLNSLHHIPEALVEASLREALRVTRKDEGRIVVVEPLAIGSFFAAMRPVEDETEVREAAQEAIKRFVASGEADLVDRVECSRHETFADLDSFVARLATVDPERATVAAYRHDALSAAFAEHAVRAPDGRFALQQPLRAHVLRRRS